jgi:hypothetical protein
VVGIYISGDRARKSNSNSVLKVILGGEVLRIGISQKRLDRYSS